MKRFFGAFVLILGLFIQNQALSSFKIIEGYCEGGRDCEQNSPHKSQHAVKTQPSASSAAKVMPAQPITPEKNTIKNTMNINGGSSSSSSSSYHTIEDRDQRDGEDLSQNKSLKPLAKKDKRKYYEETAKHQPYWSFSKNVQVSALLSLFIYTTTYTILGYNGIESFYYGCLFFPVFYNIFRLMWI